MASTKVKVMQTPCEYLMTSMIIIRSSFDMRLLDATDAAQNQTFLKLLALYSNTHLYQCILAGCIAQLEERRSLAGKLTLSCARPSADG